MSCQKGKDSPTTREPRYGPVSGLAGGLLACPKLPSLLPLHPRSSSRRRGPASPRPTGAGGAHAAQCHRSRRSTSNLPSPCPARALGQRTPAHPRTPAGASPPLPQPPGRPGRRAESAVPTAQGGDRAGEQSCSRRLSEQPAPHTLLPFAASKQLAGTLRAAPPSPRRGSAPPRAPAPPPPTWSVSLSTAILPLLGAHTHTGPRPADVKPGAGEAEGTARGKKKKSGSRI